ncbi:hypothetical protein [Ciceribacter sp. L1K22]|uniref:hypothetical protein n=1 Tax=Ciceribacter sp. L1K22 TaxID=2820275 RepID=UPI001ABDA534|nr:hypothetical protein [Ciceribacter sp. L1K22]MBO3761971.1 hypothetical protein [Ciceribacter sp. L1K22]
MANYEPEEQEDEKPLDPAMENVRRKMVKLQLVSGGIMFLMFLAVLAAIVYKVTQSDEPRSQVATQGLAIPSDQPIAAAALLPAGFTVLSADLSGSQILFYGTTADGIRKALVFDLTVGRIIADVTVTGN